MTLTLVDMEELKEGFEDGFPLLINGICYSDLFEVQRSREPLARTKTSINMIGHKKSGSFPLLRNGELIPVYVEFNQRTKFASLQVGKNVVTSKQRQGSQNTLFPLFIAIAGLDPL